MSRFLIPIHFYDGEIINEIMEADNAHEASFRIDLKYQNARDYTIMGAYELGAVNHLNQLNNAKEKIEPSLTICSVLLAEDFLRFASKSEEFSECVEEILDRYNTPSKVEINLSKRYFQERPIFFKEKIMSRDGNVIKEALHTVESCSMNPEKKSISLRLQLNIDT
jgi:hypothetical protein